MTGDYIRRTAITRLVTTPAQRDRLQELLDAWQRGCQIAVNEAWRECESQRAIQSLCYDKIRSETGLGSQHTILATHQAAEAISACATREANGRSVSKPEFTAPTVRYDTRTMSLFDDGTVSLSTTDSRIRCQLALPSSDDGYQQQFLENDAWGLTESTLTLRDGTWYLHLGFRRSRPSPESSMTENGTVLGVDLGIENIAVTSTGRFFSGAKLWDRRGKQDALNRGLQQTGTRSSYRTLRQSSERTRRYATHYLHTVAKEIVSEARRYGCCVIAVEELSGISDRLPDRRKFQTWAFGRLIDFIEYKAASAGIEVQRIQPAGTSQQCSRTDCRHSSPGNRRSQAEFHCEECGYEVHADYNAAKNVGLRALRCGHTPSHRVGVSQCALKSGTVTLNGGFTAYPDGFEIESTDKSTPVDS